MRIARAAAVIAALAATRVFAGLNPADPGLPVVTIYGQNYSGNTASVLCVDCHTENPKPTAGTHFVEHLDGVGPRLTNHAAWEKITAWAGGGFSKYASPSIPAPNAASVTGVAGGMICESCHSLKANVDGGNNLLDQWRPELDPSTLCEGCHAGPAAGPTSHHPMTGDLSGADDEVSAAHPLNRTHSSHVRAVPVAGSGVTYPTVANTMNCASCHTAHGAALGGAARILKRGYSASSDGLITGGPVNVNYVNGVPVSGDAKGSVKVWNTGDLVPGIDRQADITAVFGSPYRLVTNQDPLCDACHVP